MPTTEPLNQPSLSAEAVVSAPGRGGARTLRIIVLIVLLILIAVAAALLLFTARGNELMHHPHRMRGEAAGFVHRHPYVAPLIFVATYVLLGLLALPVWWFQMLGGYAFGVRMGVTYSLVASTIGGVTSARFSHLLAADWFHRLESRLTRLKKVDEAFGHNGLMVVMAVRLCHVLPFGLSNYAFGLTTMRSRDIALGTFLGSLPAVCVYVAIGGGGHRDWHYMLSVILLNAILIVPVVIHYLWTRATAAK